MSKYVQKLSIASFHGDKAVESALNSGTIRYNNRTFISFYKTKKN